jgi:hypothetical protein
MKNGIIFGVVAISLILGNAGCRSRCFESIGKDRHGNEHGVPSNSIDGYAKAHGVTRAEAAKRMREEMAPPSPYGAPQPSAEMTATTSENVNK